ncbi:TCPD [Hepatospora eriocheir]|uniref:TCPD n=1 Tax=Hepatospora eriocheir TaxID=1081669 RepID=A0A1X0Q629_9MICR|nr:TCPD [Hepatospora eriocheir]
MVVDEAERNLQDAISVVACLKKDLYIVPGGCSIETGMSKVLESYVGDHSMIVRRLSKALIALPHFLSSNMGLNSIEIVTNLKKSMEDYPNLGISISNRVISDMIVDDIITQPAEVFKSMIVLAFETAEMLLKIDDMLPSIY